MKKIPTLFVRDSKDMSRFTAQVNPECQWVLDGEGVATRKYDGTCVMLDATGKWWARREVKPGKTPPLGWVEASHDEVTGERQGWEPMDQSPFIKPMQEALSFLSGVSLAQGTYELIGPKINGDPEQRGQHLLIRHADAERTYFPFARPCTALMMADWVLGLGERGWEGLVWHHPDGRMAKLKAKDFA